MPAVSVSSVHRGASEVLRTSNSPLPNTFSFKSLRKKESDGFLIDFLVAKRWCCSRLKILNRRGKSCCISAGPDAGCGVKKCMQYCEPRGWPRPSSREVLACWHWCHCHHHHHHHFVVIKLIISPSFSRPFCLLPNTLGKVFSVWNSFCSLWNWIIVSFLGPPARLREAEPVLSNESALRHPVLFPYTSLPWFGCFITFAYFSVFTSVNSSGRIAGTVCLAEPRTTLAGTLTEKRTHHAAWNNGVKFSLSAT